MSKIYINYYKIIFHNIQDISSNNEYLYILEIHMFSHSIIHMHNFFRMTTIKMDQNMTLNTCIEGKYFMRKYRIFLVRKRSILPIFFK